MVDLHYRSKNPTNKTNEYYDGENISVQKLY